MPPSRVALLAAALAAGATAVRAQQRLTIEACESGWAGELFDAPAVGVAGPVTQNGTLCVDFDASSLLLAPCTGSAQQQWTFHPDGTVSNGADGGQCWNVFAGSTSAGTSLVMYACGSRRPSDVAANDVFSPLPAARQILANESGLCVSSTMPPAPPPPSPAFYCQLNGEYDAVTGTCDCYAPWSGANCSVLAVLPARPPPSGYGMRPNVTAWGGNVVFYEGQYHAFISEIIDGCPLTNWGSNSQCSHAVSDDIEGPYSYSEAAVGTFCHNTHIATFQNGSQTVFALFHIGDGTGGNPKNCSKGEDDGVAAVHPASGEASRAGSAAGGSTLHVATSPYGPWSPAPQPPSCNNPAPWLMSNGTWLLLCDSRTLYSSPTLFGPWTELTSLNPPGGVPGTYEDAYLFVDPRGYYHVIFHVYTTDVPDTCVGTTVSGHFYSADAFSWYASDDQPLGSVIEFADGTAWQLSTRERPKLYFDALGTPTHVMNGVCYGSSFCAPTPCVNCKYDWATAWVIQPLNLLA